MRSIRALINAHVYGMAAARERVASRVDAPRAMSRIDRKPLRRRVRAATDALVRTIRSFEPEHAPMCVRCRSPVSSE